MKRNHIFNHNEEVEKETPGTSYSWKVGANGSLVDVLSGEQVNLEPGSNITIARTKSEVNGQVTHNLKITAATQGDTNNYLEEVTGNGNSEVSFKLKGITSPVKRDFSHEHPPKKVVNISTGSPTIPAGHNRLFGNLTSSNPTFTIGTKSADDEFEGVFTGEGVCTFTGSGVTVTCSEYHLPKIPKGGVFGIKYLTPTTAVLFGTLMPKDL